MDKDKMTLIHDPISKTALLEHDGKVVSLPGPFKTREEAAEAADLFLKGIKPTLKPGQ